MSEAPAKSIPYRVDTPRLILRCWSPEDTAELRAALDASADHLRPWIPFMKDEPRSFEQTLQFVREARVNFDSDSAWHYGVFERATGRLVGGNMLNPRVGEGGLELGYWTCIESVRRGFALEASQAMVRCGFEIHGAGRAEIHCAPENRASAAVPARLGFQHEATLKQRASDTDGYRQDLMIWTLFERDYPGTVSSQLPCSAWDGAGRVIEMAAPMADQERVE